MRIGINTLFLVPGDVGGTEVYLRQTLKEMLTIAAEINFVLFCSRDNHELLSSDLLGLQNVEFILLPLKAAHRPWRILAEQLLLPGYVRKAKVDVLWSPGYTAPIRCCCPQAVTIHDLQYKTHPADLSFLERHTLDFLVSSACRVCASVIAVSEFSKQEIVRHGFAREEKVFAILEGVDSGLSAPVNLEIANSVTSLTSSPYILCVAHSYPHKNIHLLIEAFGQLTETIPHHLVVVGKARRGEARVEKSLAALSSRERVHRLSNLEIADLRAVYHGAALFVLPSEYEGFGLPILEAMLSRVPVITTNKASLPEVGGSHAVYVKECSSSAFARAIEESLGMDGQERQEKLDNAFLWASSFTWKKSASRTLEVLIALTDTVRNGDSVDSL